MWNTKLYNQLKRHKTPFYFYDLGLLSETLQYLIQESKKYNFQVHYALKANADARVLKKISDAGLGADCVSGNEILHAIKNGFARQKIFFAGVGKTDDEINIGLDNQIGCFNCESPEEIIVINQLAKKRNKKANIALRINPDVEAHTHDYITTGKSYNKFGIIMSDLLEITALLKRTNNVKLIGIHFHIGSQITSLEVYRELCLKVNDIEQWFYKQGIHVQSINLGGGLGIDYNEPDSHLIPDFKSFFEEINRTLRVRFGQKVHFEIGRAIVGQMGNLISRALFTKKTGDMQFAIIDAGMTELIRPALYHSYHKIENITQGLVLNGNAERVTYDVVGPICETSDFLGKEVLLPKTSRGDILAIRSVGAYAQTMASNYNLRKKAKVVYWD